MAAGLVLLAAVMGLTAGPVPDAVREGRWRDVDRLTAPMEHPPSPAMTLVSARAARLAGQPERALSLCRRALPQAGELAAALRLEAAAAAVDLGRDPFPLVQPLLTRQAPEAQRRAAGELLHESWARLPVAVLSAHRQRSLSAALRRRLEGMLAVRTGDVGLAGKLLATQDSDAVATDLCAALVATGQIGKVDPLRCGNALLTGGRWREARELLDSTSVPEDPEQHHRYFFLRGRAAYRLGDRSTAATLFEAALSTASKDAERFAAAVQRARVAELTGDDAAALDFWQVARRADPQRSEGWDGAAKALVRTQAAEAAVSLLGEAPGTVLRDSAPRLAAVLMARGEFQLSRALMARLSAPSPAGLLARVVLQDGGPASAPRDSIGRLLGDSRVGRWRDLLLGPSGLPSTLEGVPPASRDPGSLAGIAVSYGLDAARTALLRALAQDPQWAHLVAGALPTPEPLPGIIQDLVTVGLEGEAARLYPHRFPGGSPAETAWSAMALAAWGNGPAALTRGERLWALVGPLPAVLLPDALLTLMLPRELVADVRDAAAAAGIAPALLVAVVRQESRFRTTARSSAGALGVAQVMPDTALRLGIDPAQLWDPATSFGVAARELARLQEVLGERPLVVAAAYNAGESVVRSWLVTLGDTADQRLFALQVPYSETAGYVLAVREGMELARHLR